MEKVVRVKKNKMRMKKRETQKEQSGDEMACLARHFPLVVCVSLCLRTSSDSPPVLCLSIFFSFLFGCLRS